MHPLGRRILAILLPSLAAAGCGVPEAISVKVLAHGKRRTKIQDLDPFRKLVDNEHFKPCPNPTWLEFDEEGGKLGAAFD